MTGAVDTSGTAMRVTILGSGTCVPSLARSSCAVLAAIGSTKLLLDLGPGTMRRLLRTGTTIFDLSHLLFSHLHPDHTSELVPLLFATKYPDGERRQRPLTVIAGAGFRRFFDGLSAVYGQWIALPPATFSIREMPTEGPGQFRSDTFSLATRPMRHSPESIGFRLSTPDGTSLVYSGDTDVTPELVRLAAGTNLLICECALPDEEKTAGHLTPSEAGRMASEAGVGHLVLTHFYPECDTVDITAQCRQTYQGPLTLARDLLTFEIGANGCATIPSA
ncbi:MAG: MBL fold metallo-hydrolase [Desulfosarcinaceae bacterium]|nr:MBL fold metallo-hydrolase [Desulfosarcinaceae bacterium]